MHVCVGTRMGVDKCGCVSILSVSFMKGLPVYLILIG
jgi:hypothetical protein